MSKMPCDNLISAFEWEFKSYQKMRDYFLAGDWDYMVLATDDIVVKPEHIKISYRKTWMEKTMMYSQA
jgi:hypothetical protein